MSEQEREAWSGVRLINQHNRSSHDDSKYHYF